MGMIKEGMVIEGPFWPEPIEIKKVDVFGNKLSRTERYKLGKALSDNSDHLLFLTATPHKGDPENFRLFLDLLVRGFFATQKLIDASLENKDNPLFIRRLKEDLKDFEGKPIFTNRYPKTIKFRIRKDGFMVIDSIPYEVRKIAEEVDFKNRYGSILREYSKATFDKEIAFKNPDAEFISFGHPLFEGLLEWVKRNYFANLQKGAMFKDPAGRYNGILWFFEGEVKDNRQAEIKRKYGVKSLVFLIGELDAELAELYERQVEGDSVELAIRNKEERKRQYEASLKTLQLEIEQEVSLAISMLKFIGAVLVKPEYSKK